MDDRQYFMSHTDLAVKLVDLAIVPTSFVRRIREYDTGDLLEGSFSKGILYTSAAAAELCRLAMYFSVAQTGLERLF